MDWSGILVGGAAAGFVLFCWYGLAWMVLHHHKGDYVPVPEPERLGEVLADLKPADAFYALPHYAEFPLGMKDPAFDARMRKGPNAVIVVFPPGPPMAGKTFVGGLALNLIEGIGCGVLLALLGTAVQGLGDRLLLFALLGLVVGATTYGSQTLYAHLPRRFSIGNTVDKTVGYALVGLVLHLLGPVAG